MKPGDIPPILLFLCDRQGWSSDVRDGCGLERMPFTNYRNKIHARISEPNDNITMAMGNKTVVDAVFADTGLDVFLDGLKRSHDNSVAAETAALVANSVEMTGISVSRIDRILQLSAIDLQTGKTYLSDYFKPGSRKRWPEAEWINHISYEKVKGRKTIAQHKNELNALFRKGSCPFSIP